MKILIVDDHPLMRKGLISLLHHSNASTVVVEAGDAGEALTLLAAQDDIDIIVLDLFMPGETAWPALSTIGRSRRDVPILVLSSSEDPEHVRRALSMGALGYVPKSASPQTFLSAIHLLINGDLYIPPLLVEDAPPRPSLLSATLPKLDNRLTERQVEILRLLAEGVPNKVIARHLDLSEKTVKAHVTAIFRALNVVNRTQAANAGREAGLV